MELRMEYTAGLGKEAEVWVDGVALSGLGERKLGPIQAVCWATGGSIRAKVTSRSTVPETDTMPFSSKGNM